MEKYTPKYMGKSPNLNKMDLDAIESFNLQIPEQDISILKENNLIPENTDWNNVSDVFKVIKNVISSDKDEKEILYMLGIILTHNKNEYIKDLKKDFYKVQSKIHNQRVYINKLVNTYAELKNELRNVSHKYSSLKNNRNKNDYIKQYKKYNQIQEDEIAWKKANDEFNRQFNNLYSQSIDEQSKKKIVIVKKKPIPNNPK